MGWPTTGASGGINQAANRFIMARHLLGSLPSRCVRNTIRRRRTLGGGQDHFLLRFDVLQALLVETLQLALEVRLHFGQVLDSGGGHFDQFLHGEIQIVWFEIRICPFRPLGATQSGGPFQETNEIPRTCIDAMEKKTNKKDPSCSLKHGDVQWRQLKSQSLPTLTVEMEPPRRRFKSSHRKAENQNRKGPTRPTDGARPIGHCENDVSAIKKKQK